MAADTIPLRPTPSDPLDAPHAPSASGRLASPAVAVEPLLLAAAEAARLCGVSPASWYRLVSAGRCPAPVRLSRGCVRWRAEELRDWIAAFCPSRREWEVRRAVDASGRPG
jgi:predicted DNA-binding transcriptional regulator AlpA